MSDEVRWRARAIERADIANRCTTPAARVTSSPTAMTTSTSPIPDRESRDGRPPPSGRRDRITVPTVADGATFGPAGHTPDDPASNTGLSGCVWSRRGHTWRFPHTGTPSYMAETARSNQLCLVRRSSGTRLRSGLRFPTAGVLGYAGLGEMPSPWRERLTPRSTDRLSASDQSVSRIPDTMRAATDRRVWQSGRRPPETTRAARRIFCCPDAGGSCLRQTPTRPGTR